jgi:uroporphyrinogen-III decarboxylase
VKYVPLEKVSSVQPVNPLEDKNWSVSLKAAKIMMDKVGEEVAVVGCINSPALIASEIIGLESMMMAQYQSPDWMHELMRTVTQSSKAYAEEAARIGLGEVFIENGTAGGELVSQELYERGDRKYLAEEMRVIEQLGMRTIIHNCAALPYYESQLELRPSAIHIHLVAVDRNELFSMVRGKTCMMAGTERG